MSGGIRQKAPWFTGATLSLLIATVWPSPLRADLLAPGTRALSSHELVIENLRDFPDDVFFSYNAAVGESAPVTADGRVSRINLSSRNMVYVVAIPKSKLATYGGRPDPAWFPEEPPRGMDLPVPQLPAGVACTVERMPFIRAVSRADPTVRIVTYLRVTKVGNLLKVVESGQRNLAAPDMAVTIDRTDTDEDPRARPARVAAPGGAPIFVWAGIPAVAIAAIIVILLRRRRATRRMGVD